MSVESVNQAGREVISSEGGADAASTRGKLDRMNHKWDTVLAKMRDRQLELQDALRDVSHVHSARGGGGVCTVGCCILESYETKLIFYIPVGPSVMPR